MTTKLHDIKTYKIQKTKGPIKTIDYSGISGINRNKNLNTQQKLKMGNSNICDQRH